MSELDITTAPVDETDETEEVVSYDPITPFYAAGVTNALLQAAGSDRKVTPQMMYTYHKKGTIASATVEGSDKKHFDGNAFKEWLDKYLAGGTASTRVDVEALAAQYA
jgi:hypothetical protein